MFLHVNKYTDDNKKITILIKVRNIYFQKEKSDDGFLKWHCRAQPDPEWSKSPTLKILPPRDIAVTRKRTLHENCGRVTQKAARPRERAGARYNAIPEGPWALKPFGQTTNLFSIFFPFINFLSFLKNTLNVACRLFYIFRYFHFALSSYRISFNFIIRF